MEGNSRRLRLEISDLKYSSFRLTVSLAPVGTRLPSWLFNDIVAVSPA